MSDPTADEESLSSGTLTVVVKAETGEICQIHQPGTDPLKHSVWKQCVSQAQKKAKAVVDLINTAISSSET